VSLRGVGILELQTGDKLKAQNVSEQLRPAFAEIYLQLAIALAERSTCARLKVGTVITSTDFRKVLAVGYNGNATGLPNCCDRHEAGNCGCLHSEENAVINCDSPRFIEKYVFVTHLPCSACAKRLINLGNVKRVYFEKDYRSRDSLELFRAVGIEVRQLTSGFALQHLGGESREVIL
jgi:dCMP deaminase